MHPERVTTSELAKFLGITVQRAHQLENAGTLTKGEDRKYDLKQAVQDYCARLRETAAGRQGTGEGGLDPVQESARLKKVQADLIEIKLAQMRGEVISSDEVLVVWQRIIAAARARIMSLTTRLPTMIHHLDKPDIAIIENEVREVLERLTEDGKGSLDEVRKETIATTEPE